MQTRVYHIPPDFIPPFSDVDTFDPFSYQPIPDPPDDQSRQMLEAVGVDFRPGASCRFDTFTALLTVHNTPGNLDLVEKYVDVLSQFSPKTIRWRLEIIELPASKLPAGQNARDQLAALHKLAAQEESGVRPIASMLVEGKGGSHILQQSAWERSFLQPPEQETDQEYTLKVDSQTVGARFEVEGTIWPDDSIIDANVAIHAPVPPPASRPVRTGDPLTGSVVEYPVDDVREVEWITGVQLRPGETKLVGMAASPWGGGLQLAAFLTGEVLHYEHSGVFPLFEAPPQGIETPAGMIAMTIHMPSGAYSAAMPGREHDSLLTWLDAPSQKSPGSSFRLERDRIHIINTKQNAERISVVVHYLNIRLPKNLRVMVHTIEAPASMLDKALTTDDDAFFGRLENDVASGKGRFIDSSAFEVLPGSRFTRQTGDKHVVLDELVIDEKGRAWPQLATREAGAMIEFEGTLSPDLQYIYVNLRHELHAGPPQSHRERFLVPKTVKHTDLPLTDFRAAKTVTGLTLRDGRQRLFAAHQPPADKMNGNLWFTFIRADLAPQYTPLRPRVPDPLPAARQPTGDPSALEVRFFRVPPDFLSFVVENRKTAKELLEENEIPFPKGSSATFIPVSSQIVVRNTQTNLALTEAYLEKTCQMPSRSVAITSQVIEASGPILRQFALQAAKPSNHEALLARLLALPEAKLLDTSYIEGLSGGPFSIDDCGRFTVDAGNEVSYLAKIERDKQGRTRFLHEKRRAGLRLELRSRIDPNRRFITLDVKGEWHTAPPTQEAAHLTETEGHRLDLPLTVFHAHTFFAAGVISDGSTHLLSMWKPFGEDRDVLQALFITVRIMPE